MAKPLSEAPVAQFEPMTFITGQFPWEMARLAEQHGPLLRYVSQYGPDSQREIAFLVGPEANRFVFHTEREAFSHERGWTPLIGDLMGHGLLNMDGREWERSRKMWNPAFTQSYMQAYLPLMRRVIETQTASWPTRGEVDVYAEARTLTFTVAATALAGMEQPQQVARLQELFALMIPHQMFQSEEEYGAYERNAWAAKEELDATLLKIIRQRREAPAEAAPNDVLGLIVRARDDEGIGLTDEEVLAHLYILLVAGHETTTTLSAWTLYNLATLPDHRERIEAELRATLGDAPLTVETAHHLKTLDNFIKETGRLHTPVLNVPRGAVRDIEFAGYVIPAGAQVRLSVCASHRLASVFAAPEQFDPDRFALPRDEEKRTPYGLITFGGGARLCIGINFANIEVKMLAIHALRHFEMEATLTEPPLELGFITPIIPSGIPLRIRPRP